MTKILEHFRPVAGMCQGGCDPTRRRTKPSRRLNSQSGGGGLGRPILRFDPFERFEKHGFFFQTFKIQIKVISFFQKDYCTGEAPPYGHLIINTVTSQPLSIGRLAKRLNFSSKNTSLIRSPVNTAKCFFCFLATENSIHFKLYSKTKGYTKKEQCVPSCLSSTRGSVIRPL